jgi:hypothetical protein
MNEEAEGALSGSAAGERRALDSLISAPHWSEIDAAAIT